MTKSRPRQRPIDMVPSLRKTDEQTEKARAVRKAWQKQMVAVKLDQETIDDLKQVAKHKHISLSTLIKEYIHQGLDRETR